MRRSHAMPFGASYLGDGRTRFRLWAPAAEHIALEVVDGTRAASHAMERREGGWFERVAPALPGARYCYVLPGGLRVPDPASRYNPEDAHNASEVIDPGAYEWQDVTWRGRPWHEAVLYELHVGAYTARGTFGEVEARLDALTRLGITAIELMPLADFPGARNWGYDGVLPYAPDASYGRPEDLKRLVDAAHARSLMVFVDVVYNHFGPEGNYLSLYAPQFFTERHHTPWGAAINYDDQASETVRAYFIHNALYWLEEYHIDGLRLDAVHAIMDDSDRHVLIELAERVRSGPGRKRHAHLVLENDANHAAYLKRGAHGRTRWYDAQWNDDWHHVFHVLLTGERGGYYADYARDATRLLARCLAEGYAYQGEPSAHRGGTLRGEASAALPPTAFVSFLQNHDQIGNRARGERLVTLAPEAALRAAVCAWLLAPEIPIIFMGEEYGADSPFLFFCDFGGELADAVREGRRNEFAGFEEHGSGEAQQATPDPGAADTYARSKLRWDEFDRAPHRAWYDLYARLLGIRSKRIVPLLAHAHAHAGRSAICAPGAVIATWTLAHGAELELRLNLSECAVSDLSAPAGELLHSEPPSARQAFARGEMPAHAAACFLRTEART